jgi:hypothetical protein
MGAGSSARVAIGFRAVRASEALPFAFCCRAEVLWILTADELQYDARAKHGCGAGLEDATKASSDPSTGLRRSFDQQALSREIAGAECIEPDAVGGLVDGQGKLGLHA